MSSSQQPSGSLTLFLGVAGALASFGVATWLIASLGHPSSHTQVDSDRFEKKAAVAKEEGELLVKYGLADNPKAVFEKASQAILARKLGVSKVVVPGSPTALAQSAPAPAPAPAKGAAPAPAAAKPAAPAVQPAAPAPAAPAPAPAAQPPAPAPAASAPPAPAPAAPTTPAPKG